MPGLPLIHRECGACVLSLPEVQRRKREATLPALRGHDAGKHHQAHAPLAKYIVELEKEVTRAQAAYSQEREKRLHAQQSLAHTQRALQETLQQLNDLRGKKERERLARERARTAAEKIKRRSCAVDSSSTSAQRNRPLPLIDAPVPRSTKPVRLAAARHFLRHLHRSTSRSNAQLTTIYTLILPKSRSLGRTDGRTLGFHGFTPHTKREYRCFTSK
ncbi:unnamed protein product [Trichogramma brassicae]|uniref:Uncharacterized protein n=1 Tax=Trichogramma brassicae TaxID=86971 RepID=A0A6H5J0Z8_9HYME|nr:unnamed protein product [Trichogramma brassicae]